MVDTLRLRLDVTDSGGTDLVSTANYLTEADEMLNQRTGELWMRGTLGTFKVTANRGSLYIEGALPTILFDTNARILTRREVAQSVEKLSDLLHLPLSNGRVTRLDCSYHWQMSKPVPEYINRLGELSRFKRVLKTCNSLYYDKGGKSLTNSLVFYNKSNECSDKRKPVPDAYVDSMLLRYECRWLKNPSAQFEVNELKASTLSEKPFYQMMVRKWSDYYFSISKNRNGSFNFDGVRDVRSAKNWLLGYLLSRTSATNIDEVMQSMKDRKLFSDAKYYSRLRTELRECVLMIGKERENDLISELDSNVRNVLAYCR